VCWLFTLGGIAMINALPSKSEGILLVCEVNKISLFPEASQRWLLR
jgi:hypothetical protein